MNLNLKTVTSFCLKLNNCRYSHENQFNKKEWGFGCVIKNVPYPIDVVIGESYVVVDCDSVKWGILTLDTDTFIADRYYRTMEENLMMIHTPPHIDFL